MSPKKLRRTGKTAQPLPGKPQKPFVRTSTWIAVLLFVALAGVIVFLNQRETQAGADATPTPLGEDAFVFDNQSAIISIEIAPSEGETLRVERNAENIWVLKLPIEAEADQGAVEAAVSQVAALKIKSKLDANPKILGLDKPAYVITVKFQDGAAHTLEVGDRTPTGNGYYVRLDGKEIMIAAASGIDALTRLPTNPPYLNTPTPTATATPPPTETPVPPTEPESTPETETPQP